jgi:hypothetical protein
MTELNRANLLEPSNPEKMKRRLTKREVGFQPRGGFVL